MLIPFLSSFTICLIHGMYWLIVKRGFLLVHAPTLNGDSQSCPNPCRSQTLNQASFNKNLRCRFFTNLCSWSNRRIFSLEVCIGSPVLWFYTKNHRRTPLCFPNIILLFQHKQRVQGTAWKIHISLNSVVSTLK